MHEKCAKLPFSTHLACDESEGKLEYALLWKTTSKRKLKTC